ncbi:MAG: HD domain-containing protein [Actinomycetota bacterium]|nr:HD domain-containing protein [Actinomycetota bacterium]
MDTEQDTFPDSPAAMMAAEVCRHFHSAALVNHCLRSYLWATSYASANDIGFDPELLYVAAMLHDLGLVAEFDSHTVDFETAGGSVGWVFAAGAGWPADRRARVLEIVVAHMRGQATAESDPEGYLLTVATSLDISGLNAVAWPEVLRRNVVHRYPMLGLGEEFLAHFRDQASRKPDCTAAASVRSGIAERIAANPLNASRRCR